MAGARAPFNPRTFLAVAWAVNVCINAFYIAPAPVFPQMIADLGIGKAQAGSLISFYLVAILLSQLPAGYAMDRTDPRRTIVLASAALVGLSAAMTLLPRYDALLALRAAAGVPIAFIFAPTAFLVARAFGDRPGRALGVFLSAPPAGVAIGTFLAPSLAVALGWPSVFIAFNVPLVPLIPLFLRASAGLPPRVHEAFRLGEFLAAFRNKELWKVGLAFASSYAAYIFYASWTPTVLTEAGITAPLVVGALSAAIPAAGIVSRPFGGHLAEGTFRADKRWVPGLAFALLIGVSAAVPVVGASAIPLLVAAGFLAQFPFSVYYLFSAQVMPRRFGGTAYAFMNTVSLIGGAVSPGLAGLLADVTGSFAAAFAMIAGTAALGLLLVVGVRER